MLVHRKRGFPIFYFIVPEWVLYWVMDEWDRREKKMGL